MEANLEGACGRGVTFWSLNQSTSFLSRITRRINMHTTPSPRKKLFFSLKKTTPNRNIRVFNWVLGWRYCRVQNRQYPENRWGMEGWNWKKDKEAMQGFWSHDSLWQHSRDLGHHAWIASGFWCCEVQRKQSFIYNFVLCAVWKSRFRFPRSMARHDKKSHADCHSLGLGAFVELHMPLMDVEELKIGDVLEGLAHCCSSPKMEKPFLTSLPVYVFLVLGSLSPKHWQMAARHPQLLGWWESVHDTDRRFWLSCDWVIVPVTTGSWTETAQGGELLFFCFNLSWPF